MSTEKSFLVKIVTPKGNETSFECESLVLNIGDGKRGVEGGAYGIRKGHAPAVLSLERGRICGTLDSKEVFCATADGGFARVEGDHVVVVLDAFEREDR